MKSPDRPRGPSSAVVGATTELASTHPFNQTNEQSGDRSSSLSLFRAVNGMSPTREPTSMSAPSTLNSVFGESAFGEGSYMSTASPTTAHNFADSLQNVVETGQQLSDAFQMLSLASSKFGQAVEECSHHKPCAASAENIAVAGGLHLLISNHLQILGSAVQSQVVDPVKTNLAEHKVQLEARESQFRAQLKEAKRALDQAEARNRQAARRKNRNLAEYRVMLLDMTSQIDDIHRIKFEFLCDLFSMGSSQAEQLKQGLGKTAGAELEIFESIARKGWSGGGLDSLLQDDPFEGQQEHFTVLGNNNRLLPDLSDPNDTIRGSVDADDTLEMGGGPESSENILENTPTSRPATSSHSSSVSASIASSPTPTRPRMGSIDSSDGII